MGPPYARGCPCTIDDKGAWDELGPRVECADVECEGKALLIYRWCCRTSTSARTGTCGHVPALAAIDPAQSLRDPRPGWCMRRIALNTTPREPPSVSA